MSKNGKENCTIESHESQDKIYQQKLKPANETKINYKIKSIHQFHPKEITFQRWSRVPVEQDEMEPLSYKSRGKRGPEMIQSSRGTRWDGTIVIQVHREVRSRDDRGIPRRSHIMILSQLPIQGSKSEGNLSACWVCCMFSFTIKNPTFLSTIHHRSSLPFLIRSSRFIQIQMENWAMAGSVRRRMECGIQFSCLQTVSDWEENMAEFPVSIQCSRVHGGRKECCLLQV